MAISGAIGMTKSIRLGFSQGLTQMCVQWDFLTNTAWIYATFENNFGIRYKSYLERVVLWSIY